MATPAQILANQQNAQLSTGPQFEEGKQRSAQNAQKHGLDVSPATLQREEAAQYTTLVAELTTEYRPKDVIARTLVDELATAMLRLRRCQHLEAQLLNEAEDLLSAFAHLDKIDRYRRAAERTFYRCLKELQALRAAAPPPSPAVHTPVPAPPTAKPAPIQNEPKPGRNSPCPCQSGRKYKQCCLGKTR